MRLLLELCDDRGDGDDGPKAAKKAFHARCAYLANGAGARSLKGTVAGSSGGHRARRRCVIML